VPNILSGSQSIEDQIQHGEHLTWVDKLRSAFFPDVTTDSQGNTVYPKTEYLTNVAAKRYGDWQDQQRAEKAAAQAATTNDDE